MKRSIMLVFLVLSLLSMGLLGCGESTGTNTTVRSTKFEDAQGGCSNGGIKLEFLVDGSVDSSQTQYLCNGMKGENGKTASIQTTPFNGKQGTCDNGGVKVEVLMDGTVLDEQTQYLCNGENGTNASIQTTPFEGKQGSCTNGGIKVEVFTDGVQNGQTQYICNLGNSAGSSNTSIQTTPFEGEKGSCTNGGVMIEVLVDGVVQNDQTQYICNGADGHDIRVGDIITFGHYEQDNDTSNGKEPITWRILDINGSGQYLIISEKVLDATSYNTTNISITWDKSTIRSWLNGYSAEYNTVGNDYTTDNFIDAAFTDDEQAKIVALDVPAQKNPEYYNNVSPGETTTDKIFLLSINEAKSYFSDNADRKAEATRYAVARGAYVRGSSSENYTTDGSCADLHCNSVWWLRTPGFDADSAAYVYGSGSVMPYGYSVFYTFGGIRPVMWIIY